MRGFSSIETMTMFHYGLIVAGPPWKIEQLTHPISAALT